MEYDDMLSKTPVFEHTILRNRAYYEKLILSRCSPLLPIPTKCTALLHEIHDIKAVLFDIYGTLLISGSGEVGSSIRKPEEPFAVSRFYDPVSEAGFYIHTSPEEFNGLCFPRYIRLIQSSHTSLRDQGISHPEVDIISIWYELLSELLNEGILHGKIDSETLIDTALRYELYANKTWLMPGADDLLGILSRGRLVLGIVSNAQFYTPLILETLLGKSLNDTGFSSDASAWSYYYRKAKPSLDLFSSVMDYIHLQGIENKQVVYVGNDMLNDIFTARQIGLKTVLFAGDKRSLRMRKEKHQLQTCQPDAIITELPQLTDLISAGTIEE